MSIQTKRARQHSMFARLLALIGVAGALGIPRPVDARVDMARHSLEARVLAARSAISDAAQANAPDSPDLLDRQVAQSWGKWNNWNNWGNWGNWFNR